MLLICEIVQLLLNFNKKYQIEKLRKAFIGKTIMRFDGGRSSTVVLDARIESYTHDPYMRLYLDTGGITCIELSYYLSK